jgi:hypothetical protein
MGLCVRFLGLQMHDVFNPAGNNLTGPDYSFVYGSIDDDFKTSDDSYAGVAEDAEPGYALACPPVLSSLALQLGVRDT